MSNVKHNNCALRELAKSAKARLATNDYDGDELNAPKSATPQQREIYLKLLKLSKAGECVVNPVAQLADNEKLNSLPHDERQRYIINLCADYVSVKNYIDESSRKLG